MKCIRLQLQPDTALNFNGSFSTITISAQQTWEYNGTVQQRKNVTIVFTKNAEGIWSCTSGSSHWVQNNLSYSAALNTYGSRFTITGITVS